MKGFKFGDKVKTNDGQEGIVQEDQELNSDDVKVILEGAEYPNVYKEANLEKIADHI